MTRWKSPTGPPKGKLQADVSLGGENRIKRGRKNKVRMIRDPEAQLRRSKFGRVPKSSQNEGPRLLRQASHV